MLDYLSDFICCLYGKPGAYGAWHAVLRLGCRVLCGMGYRSPARACMQLSTAPPPAPIGPLLTSYVSQSVPNRTAGVVTLPFSVREGINIFLAGFVPTENLRFRDEALTFKASLLVHICC